MAARAEGHSLRVVFALFLVMAGLLTFGLGLSGVVKLGSAYRQADLALTQSGESFRAWLAEASAEVPQRDGVLAQRISARLSAIPMDRRRGLALALMRPDFWQPLAASGQDLLVMKGAVRDGILKTLAGNPMAGDLWLAAASLEATLSGFGTRGREMLRASHVFAPREMPMVIGRLDFAPLVWPLLKPEDRALLKADLDMVRQAQPQRAAAIEQALAKEGVVFQ